MVLLKCLSFFILLFMSLACNAQRQNKQVFQHKVFWSKIEVNDFFGSAKKNWGYGFDFVYRTKNEFNTGNIFSKHLREGYRPWVHYQFSYNSRFSISPIGYMHTTEYVGKQQDLLRQPYHD